MNGVGEGIIIGATGTQPLSTLGDGVLLAPRLQIGVGAVAGGVVGGGVRLHAIGEAFDQIGSLATAGAVGGGPDDGVDAEHVGAVHPDAGEAVASGTVG